MRSDLTRRKHGDGMHLKKFGASATAACDTAQTHPPQASVHQ